jgi:hypothetical protein
MTTAEVALAVVARRTASVAAVAVARVVGELPMREIVSALPARESSRDTAALAGK